jgi:hypothetical protein
MPKQISDIAHHAGCHQLLNQLFTDAVDIHRAARYEVFQQTFQAAPGIRR